MILWVLAECEDRNVQIRVRLIYSKCALRLIDGSRVPLIKNSLHELIILGGLAYLADPFENVTYFQEYRSETPAVIFGVVPLRSS